MNTCVICIEDINNTNHYTLICGHILHKDCYENLIKYQYICPTCRKKICLGEHKYISDTLIDFLLPIISVIFTFLSIFVFYKYFTEEGTIYINERFYGECIVGDFKHIKGNVSESKMDVPGVIYEYYSNFKKYSCHYISIDVNLDSPVDIYISLDNLENCYTCKNLPRGMISWIGVYTSLFQILLFIFLFLSPCFSFWLTYFLIYCINRYLDKIIQYISGIYHNTHTKINNLINRRILRRDLESE